MSRAESAELARRKLLETGRQMVEESPVNAGLDHIKVTDVARRADMTTGAIYHHWESQDDYREELIDLLLEPVVLQEGWEMDAVFEVLGNTDLTIDQLIDLVAWDNMTQLTQHPRFRVIMGFWSRATDENIRARIARSYQQSQKVRAGGMERFMTAFGRRMREPYTVEQLETALTALSEGLVLRRGVDPDSVPIGFPDLDESSAAVEQIRAIGGDRMPPVGDDESKGFNLLAEAARAIVEAFTEPVPDAD